MITAQTHGQTAQREYKNGSLFTDPGKAVNQLLVSLSFWLTCLNKYTINFATYIQNKNYCDPTPSVHHLHPAKRHRKKASKTFPTTVGWWCHPLGDCLCLPNDRLCDATASTGSVNQSVHSINQSSTHHPHRRMRQHARNRCHGFKRSALLQMIAFLQGPYPAIHKFKGEFEGTSFQLIARFLA